MNILKIFQKEQIQKVHNPIVPGGLIACTEKGHFYIKGNKKFKFISEKAVASWGLPIISTTEEKISKLLMAGILGFRDGTLLKDVSDGKMYLVSDSKIRHIINPDVLEWLNLEAILVGQKEVQIHEEGEPLE